MGCRSRFIPTGVGNISWRSASAFSLSVHPHGCGEHLVRGRLPNAFSGSSPRVWGTSITPNFNSYPSRFIPTGVGNISPSNRQCQLRTVHPHGCGEHQALSVSPTIFDGSSPRVWGTSEKWLLALAIERFIPTGVGNILSAKSARVGKAVHPHGCGEHQTGKDKDGFCIGSSPRVWGTFLD